MEVKPCRCLGVQGVPQRLLQTRLLTPLYLFVKRTRWVLLIVSMRWSNRSVSLQNWKVIFFKFLLTHAPTFFIHILFPLPTLIAHGIHPIATQQICDNLRNTLASNKYSDRYNGVRKAIVASVATNIPERVLNDLLGVCNTFKPQLFIYPPFTSPLPQNPFFSRCVFRYFLI